MVQLSANDSNKAFILIIIFFLTFGTMINFFPQSFMANQNTIGITQLNFGIIPDQFAIGSSNYTDFETGNISRDSAWHSFFLSWKNPNDIKISYQWRASGFLVTEGIFYQSGGPPPSVAQFLYPYPFGWDYINSHRKTENLSVFSLTDNTHTIPVLEARYFTYLSNITQYANLSASYVAGKMQFFIGIPKNITQQQVSNDMWSIVGQLMTFQTPQIGTPSILTSIIGICLWTPIIAVILWVLKGWL